VKNPLTERPWLLIVAALAVFVLVWTVFVVIAEVHTPATVPLVVSPAH
jgi:hypothetical protein